MQTKKVVLYLKSNKTLSFNSVNSAVNYLANIAGVLYSWPEKNGVTQLKNLVNRVPSVKNYRVYTSK